MDDRPGNPLEALESPPDQVFPGLHEHLDGHVIGYQPVFDEMAEKGELGLAGRGEPDFDLLEADFHQELEHVQLFLDAHRDGQSLVTVPQVDAAPPRRLGDGAIRPLPVGKAHSRERAVFSDVFWFHRTQRQG